MGMRHAAVMAGLALGLMSGTAQAATTPITYQVDRTDGFNSVTGTITTDGNLGSLDAADVVSFSLTLNDDFFFGPTTSTMISGGASDVFLTAGSMDFTATSSLLSFSFSGDNDTLSFFNNVGSNTYALKFYSGQSGTAFGPYVEYDTPGQNSSIFQPQGTAGVIGTAGPGVSTVPLPASAPMFGAALMALGAVGYGLKRKGKAAAV